MDNHQSQTTESDGIQSEEARFRAFIAENENAEYILEAPLLCRRQSDGRGNTPATSDQTCLRSTLSAKDMFAQMQALGFFCQLPPEPGHTYMVCQKLP